MFGDLLLFDSWSLRPHHLRALAILVTLVSLSLLFSTFSMRAGENRMWMMDPSRQNAVGRAMMSAAEFHQQSSTNTEETASFSPTTTTTTAPASTNKLGRGEVYQIIRKSVKPAVVKVAI